MKPLVYNLSLLIGLLLIGAGLAMISPPLALAIVGGLVIGLTLLGAWLASRGRGEG